MAALKVLSVPRLSWRSSVYLYVNMIPSLNWPLTTCVRSTLKGTDINERSIWAPNLEKLTIDGNPDVNLRVLANHKLRSSLPSDYTAPPLLVELEEDSEGNDSIREALGSHLDVILCM